MKTLSIVSILTYIEISVLWISECYLISDETVKLSGVTDWIWNTLSYVRISVFLRTFASNNFAFCFSPYVSLGLENIYLLDCISVRSSSISHFRIWITDAKCTYWIEKFEKFPRFSSVNVKIEVRPDSHCLSFCSIAVKWNHEEGNLEEKAFNLELAYSFRKWMHEHHGRNHDSRQERMSTLKQQRASWLTSRRLLAHKRVPQ